MTISELIHGLESMLEDASDLPVRVAMQKNYPLAGKVANLWIEETDGEPKTLWLAVNDIHGHESPYAPRSAWDEAY